MLGWATLVSVFRMLGAWSHRGPLRSRSRCCDCPEPRWSMSVHFFFLPTFTQVVLLLSWPVFVFPVVPVDPGRVVL